MREKEIADVMEQEKARGTKRRLPDPEAVAERQQRRKDMMDLLRTDDKWGFIETLTQGYGLQVGSQEYLSALKVWDEYHARKR